jgi:hypothetical protein
MSVNPLWHQLWDFSRLLGLRDRLRCPDCNAVGTWKPHGGWLDFGDIRGVRRWMCKWCGIYKGPEGWKLVTLGKECWELSDPEKPSDTPKKRCGGANPWRG